MNQFGRVAVYLSIPYCVLCATVVIWKAVKRTVPVTIFLKACPKFSPVSLKVYYLQFVSLSHFEKMAFRRETARNI